MTEEKKDEVLNEDGITSDDSTAASQPDDENREEADDKKTKNREEKLTKTEITRLEAALREADVLIESLKKETADLNEKYLRMIAEYDNYRKRASKERQYICADATAEVIAEILPILDNLERASAFSDSDKVTAGVAMLCKSFTDTLTKLGVSEIDAKGCAFDPNIHNAVMHVEDETYGENEVTEVLQKGYIMGEKVIRYAMVKVAN